MKRITLSFKLVPRKSYANKLHIPNYDTEYATFRNTDRKEDNQRSIRKQYNLEEDNTNFNHT